MIPDSHLKALKTLVRELPEDLDWRLVASTNLALHGVDVEPGDIDILATKESAERIDQTLRDHREEQLRFKDSGSYRSYIGRYLVEGVEVEVMAEMQRKNGKGIWNDTIELPEKEVLELEGVNIPTASLERELEAYRKMGKEEKAEKIEAYLE